jgi:prevent-host-death family protein
MTVEIGVRAFRNRLSYWLDRAAAGEEIIVTERGRPRARLTGADQRTTRERLIAEGLITPPTKPKSRIDIESLPRMKSGSLTDIVLEQRRSSP